MHCATFMNIYYKNLHKNKSSLAIPLFFPSYRHCTFVQNRFAHHIARYIISPQRNASKPYLLIGSRAGSFAAAGCLRNILSFFSFTRKKQTFESRIRITTMSNARHQVEKCTRNRCSHSSGSKSSNKWCEALIAYEQHSLEES